MKSFCLKTNHHCPQVDPFVGCKMNCTTSCVTQYVIRAKTVHHLQLKKFTVASQPTGIHIDTKHTAAVQTCIETSVYTLGTHLIYCVCLKTMTVFIIVHETQQIVAFGQNVFPLQNKANMLGNTHAQFQVV